MKEKVIYDKPLNKEKWAELYNPNILNSVIKTIETGNVSIWSEEICKISEVVKREGRILEIGCGTGISSLWLAKNGFQVTSLDYTQSSIELINSASKKLGLYINTVNADATEELPFEEQYFDIAFQCGLLEHFSTEQQIKLLKSWKNYCRIMISMIPNASSVAYRTGKKILETSGKWAYGLEIPKHSMAMEFTLAGIEVEKEYTIGSDWALKFLPRWHFLRRTMSKLKKIGINPDEYMQGYLLVTIGKVKV